MELISVQGLVEDILRANKATRDDDELLYLEVCKKLHIDIDNSTFGEVFRNRLMSGLPTFASVGRTRRKLQSEHEDLRGTVSVQEKRNAKRLEYLEYVRL